MYVPAPISRAIVEPTVFTTPLTTAPFLFASLIAKIVSAVSPDWEIAKTKVFLFTTGSRYKNSEEKSTSVEIFSKRLSLFPPLRRRPKNLPVLCRATLALRLKQYNIHPRQSQ